MTDAEGPSGFYLDELIAYGEQRSGWAVSLMDHEVHGIVNGLKELRERRAGEPRAPYLNNPGWTCPKCGLTEAGHVQRECDWQAEQSARPQHLPSGEPDVALEIDGPYCDDHLTDVRAWCAECVTRTAERKKSYTNRQAEPSPDDAPDSTAKFAELVTYAERYRWLRSHLAGTIVQRINPDDLDWRPEKMDALVDSRLHLNRP